MKVLIIEDTEAIAEIMSIKLMGFGHEVVDIACNGRDGLEKFHAGVYDVIVCDYDMPFIKGDEVVKEIRKTSQIPIVAASSLSAYCKLMLDAGANDYFLKNNDYEYLNELLKQVGGSK